MNNQERFKELMESYVAELDVSGLVDGSYGTGRTENYGRYERKDISNEYDFDGQADLSSVYYFEDLDLYVRFYGYYRSYDGTHFTKYEFVNPIEKTVTCYE